MTCSLRAALIEAGVEAIDDRLDGDRWTTEQFAEACLDAYLDTLAENADEWADEANVSLTWRHVPSALIAVLRGDTDDRAD